MPLQPNTQDPIVQILILAARRGFQIMAEREQVAGTTASEHNAPHGELGIGNGGAKGNSRNVPAKDRENADTNP
jgi:hypothetical protein